MPLNNIISFHKANDDCSRISSDQGINETKFLRWELKNENVIIDILLRGFSLEKKFTMVTSKPGYTFVMKHSFKVKIHSPYLN